MTTYSYQATLNDSECIAVKEALEQYRNFCDTKLADGPRAPYWAHRQAIDAVLRRLFADTRDRPAQAPFVGLRRTPVEGATKSEGGVIARTIRLAIVVLVVGAFTTIFNDTPLL